MYQWYRGATGITLNPVVGARSSSYTTPALTAGVSYWVRVSNPRGVANSTAADITVGFPPTIATQPQSQAVPKGQAASLSVGATGTGTLSYQWYEGDSGVTSAPVAAASASTLTTPAINAVTSFWVRVSSPFGVAFSSAATITPIPVVGQTTALYVKSMVGNSVTLAWSVGQGQQPVTDYLIEGGLPGQTAVLGQFATGGSATSVAVPLPTGMFWLQVRALSGATVGDPSAQTTLCVNVSCPALTPTTPLGLANGSNLGLAWRNPLENGVPTRITLQVSGSSSGAIDLPGTAESFAIGGVPSGTYNMSLVACTAAGCSTPSAPVTLSFPGACSGAPEVPTKVAVGKRGADLIIDVELPAGGAASSNFVLNVTGAFNGSVPFTVRRLTAPVPPGSYTISVAAVNACGTGPASTPVTVTIP